MKGALIEADFICKVWQAKHAVQCYLSEVMFYSHNYCLTTATVVLVSQTVNQCGNLDVRDTNYCYCFITF